MTGSSLPATASAVRSRVNSRRVLPVVLLLSSRPEEKPFPLVSLALALGAEPMVKFLCSKLHLPRPLSAGLGVTAALCFLALALLLICALVLRELGILAGYLPDFENTARGSLSSLSHWLIGFASRLPSGVREILTRNIQDFFSGGSAMLEKAAGYVLNLAGGILRHVPDSALIVGTGIISSYMISAKLPKIHLWLTDRLSRSRVRHLMDTLHRLKNALFGWLKAQVKLSGISWIILTLGLIILRIPYAVLWASLIALLDAFPILGTGMVLVPWSLILFSQGKTPQAVGMLSTYAVISLSRSILEPKLVGRQLGLDPLLTLFSLYAGYKLWGFGGMIFSPILAVAASQLLTVKDQHG